MIDKVVARNWAEYNIFRANTRMTNAVNAEINAMREKIGLAPESPAPSVTRNIVVANNLAEAGIYRLHKALDDSSVKVSAFQNEMGRIFNTVA
jgi:hypothetical protein